MDKYAFMDKLGSAGMMTKALHSEGWTCSLEKGKKKL